MDHREQVLAHEPPADGRRVRTRDGRVVGRDEEGPDGRVAQLEQRLPEPRVVHQTRRGRSRRAAHRLEGEAEAADGREQGAPAELPVGADHGGQTGDRPDALAALGVPRHPEPDPDVRRARPAVEVRETLDVGARQPGDRGDPIRSESGQDLPLEAVEPDRLTREIVPVGQPVPHEDVHHAERQRRVGADPGGDVPVGLGARYGSAGGRSRPAACPAPGPPRSWPRRGRRS